jgi:hypothetical protein
MRQTDPIDVLIIRKSSTAQGTVGLIIIPEMMFATPCIELPWRDNQTNISCIPEGEYEAFRRWSNHWNSHVYQLKNVPGRTAVQIHAGNVAGDTSLGYKTHSHGCILPGSRVGSLYGQSAVLASTPALSRFMARTMRRPLNLRIFREGVNSNV